MQSSRGGGGVAIRREGGGGRAGGRWIAARLRLGRKVRGGLLLGVPCRGWGWRCGSRGRRIGGCRKIRRGRGGGDRSRRFRNRWRCGPWFRGERGRPLSCGLD